MVPWFHVVLSHRDRDPIGADEAGRLRAVRRLVRVAGPWLVLWCLVDDHLHLLLACDRRRAGFIARNVAQALPVALAPAWIKEVRGRRYRRSLVDYLLLQVLKHGLPSHPALWGGSCFLDLAGARWLPGFRPGFLKLGLPRLRMREPFSLLGLGVEPLVAVPDERLFRCGPSGLVAACFAALGTTPVHGSREPLQVAARALACATARAVGLRLGAIAEVLHVHQKSAQRLGCRPVPAEARSALRKRIALEDRVLALACGSLPR